MNILEIIVLIIIAICVYRGYRIGFLRVIYSLVSWILVLAFVTWATPYLTDYLEKHTPLYGAVQEKCLDYIEKHAEEKIQEQALNYGGDQTDGSLGTDIGLPQSFLEEITGVAAGTADEIMKSAGIYDELAASIAHFIVEGIAFFVALIIAGIIMHWISSLLNVISRIPVLHTTNKVLGAGAGAIKGILIVWLVLYIVTLFAASEQGTLLLSYVKESSILSYLYENNILMQIITAFF